MDSDLKDEFQDTANLNEIQNIMNNLSETSFTKCLKELQLKEKNPYNLVLLKNLLQKGELDKNIVPNDSDDYIYQQYLNAQKQFKNDLKVSKISFGFAKIEYTLYLYITKENSLSLNYIKNYKNITPIDYEKYCEQDNVSNKNNSLNSEMYGEAGMYIIGYTFEFNVNFFLKSLKNFIELPNLIFDISKTYRNKEFYHELDIAYYAKQKIDFNKENILLFKTSAYFLIKGKSVSFQEAKNLEIFANSLIIGEVKSRFPKKLKSNYNKDNNLTSIITGLFMKLCLFYDLYKDMDLFNNNNPIENIQLIFFYDTMQISNLNLNLISQIIRKECIPFYKIPKNIQIHFYIIYTLPNIAGMNISSLSEEIKKLKRVYKEQKEKIDRLDEMVKKLMNDSKRKKSDESSYNYVNISENNITNEIKEYGEKQNISEKSSLNIFEDLFKTIEDDNSKESTKFIYNIFINFFYLLL